MVFFFESFYRSLSSTYLINAGMIIFNILILSLDKDKLKPVDNFKRFSWILVDFNDFIDFMVLRLNKDFISTAVFFTGSFTG